MPSREVLSHLCLFPHSLMTENLSGFSHVKSPECMERDLFSIFPTLPLHSLWTAVSLHIGRGDAFQGEGVVGIILTSFSTPAFGAQFPPDKDLWENFSG